MTSSEGRVATKGKPGELMTASDHARVVLRLNSRINILLKALYEIAYNGQKHPYYYAKVALDALSSENDIRHREIQARRGIPPASLAVSVPATAQAYSPPDPDQATEALLSHPPVQPVAQTSLEENHECLWEVFGFNQTTDTEFCAGCGDTRTSKRD